MLGKLLKKYIANNELRAASKMVEENIERIGEEWKKIKQGKKEKWSSVGMSRKEMMDSLKSEIKNLHELNNRVVKLRERYRHDLNEYSEIANDWYRYNNKLKWLWDVTEVGADNDKIWNIQPQLDEIRKRLKKY